MLYIYIELRYHRQLSLICPETVDSFFSAISGTIAKNGGMEHRTASGSICSFDETSVGYAFSASRVIGDIRAILEKNRVRLSEYLVIVDYSKTYVQIDSFSEFISWHNSIITPDDGILITSSASELLDPYLVSSALNDTSLSLYSGSRVNEAALPEIGTEKNMGKSLTFYTGFAKDPVSVFRNLLYFDEFLTETIKLNKEERQLFDENSHALDMYTRSRFSAAQPEYRVSACLDYFVLYFRALKASYGKIVPIAIYGTKDLPSSFNLFFEKLNDFCAFTKYPDPEYASPDLKNMPDDLLDLSWLVYRGINFLYIDELSAFFIHLGKKQDFMAALGKWMYSFGLLSDPTDLRSVNPALISKIESKIGQRRKKLDNQVAQFLWKQYEEGRLVPSYEFYEVLDKLSFEPPDTFLVSSVYQSEKPSSELTRIRFKFKKQILAETIEKLEKAQKKYEEGNHEESGSIVRDVLHVFQKESILAGEYRALSLIALLSLARNNCDDAVVYLEYALENAERMHDPYSILSTRFDMAMVYFILGNFHFSVCALDSVDRVIGSCYAKDWEVLVLFMKGRILFELGDYRNSEILFQTAASLASIHQIPESVSLCRVWYARSLVLQNRYASAETILMSCVGTIPEALLFLLESCLISGRPIKDIQFPPSGADLFGKTDRWALGKFIWKSGFSMVEDRCFGTSPETRIAGRMYDVMYLCYTLKFSPDADRKSILEKVSAFARVALEQKDPYAAVYCFFSYDISTQTGSVTRADAQAFLSRAFKYMQKRANEIDDNSMREQYMQNPVWNHRLYQIARDNMLI